MKVILDPKVSISARENIGVSQSAVSRDTGINRVYISQFESGKRILEDRDKQALLDYYHELGWPENSGAGETLEDPNNMFSVKDGLIVPKTLTNDEIEDLLSELYATRESAQKMEQDSIPRGFFGGVDQDKALSNSLTILLHYMKIQRLQAKLQGRSEHLEPIQTLDKAQINRDYLDLLLDSRGLAQI